ncbi:hypothetical protein DFH09DRAFT_1453918 [Mycena vulgaris]|nr:hypothetical protein DFH09DRAFT_1453918 [Mycena vulgaris]
MTAPSDGRQHASSALGRLRNGPALPTVQETLNTPEPTADSTTPEPLVLDSSPVDPLSPDLNEISASDIPATRVDRHTPPAHNTQFDGLPEADPDSDPESEIPRLQRMLPESLKITAVAINADIQGSITCKLSVGNEAASEAVLQSGLPVRTLQPPVVLRPGVVLVAHCIHRKQGLKKPEIITRNIPFQDIVKQVLPAISDGSILVDGSDIVLEIDSGDPSQILEYIFRPNRVVKGRFIHISMVKVNPSTSGRGFYYICLRADGSTIFERRLANAPYPQEIPLSPMASIHPGMDLRLCLLRRPFYIWPTKSVIKSCTFTGSEAHDILRPSSVEGVEHTFAGTPEMTVRLLPKRKPVSDRCFNWEIIRQLTLAVNKHRNGIIDRIRPPGIDRERPIPGCLEGTRERIFRKIDSWLADSNSPDILWIKGFPGSGKSCIARSLVEKFTDSPNFGSSFFFERDGGVFTAPSTMLRTIASDLCRHPGPVFMNALVSGLETQRMIDFSTTSIKDQFIRLVEKPLRCLANELRDGDTLVVVVDALDECGGLGSSRFQDRHELLASIARWATLTPLLRLVVTSRDETPFSEVLTHISTPLKLRLDSHRASRDIEAFLKREFRRIATAHSLPDSWPTQDEIRAVAEKARGLFVWAATLVKFVDQPRPRDILQQILTRTMNVEGPITELYQLILKKSFCPDPTHEPNARFLEEFIHFVGAIVASNRPLEKGSPFDDGGREIPALQPSLAILNLLNDRLRFDPSRFYSSYESNRKTADRIPRDLLYACQSWGEALVGDNNGDGAILKSVKTFFEQKFLFWVEALSLTDMMPCALVQLRSAKNWIGTCDTELAVFVDDAITFVEIFHECMAKSAPHVYLSAMTFTPNSSKIYETYSPLLQPCASIDVQTVGSLRIGRDAISAPIIWSPSGAESSAAFEGHTDDILAVLISGDGCITSASHDATIQFWDAGSGRPILAPLTHAKTKSVTSLAASKDGTLLVSGSRDGTASVWEMGSHTMLAEFAHADSVTCVALSPTGAVVVTGCRDKTVKFWNISKQRECRAAFHRHAEPVTTVAFLDAKVVISASLDGSVYLHRTSTEDSKLLIQGKIRIHSLTVAPTTRSLVAGSDSCIAVWDLSHENVPGNVRFLSPDSDRAESIAVHGSRIAAAVGKKIEIWDFLIGKRILEPLAGHKNTVTTVSFSEDGTRLVWRSKCTFNNALYTFMFFTFALLIS